jgi:hypothetical protein
MCHAVYNKTEIDNMLAVKQATITADTNLTVASLTTMVSATTPSLRATTIEFIDTSLRKIRFG